MKAYSFHRYRKRQMRQDTFIVLAPPILMLVGMLWFFRKDWIPQRVVLMLISFSSRLHDLWTIGT